MSSDYKINPSIANQKPNVISEQFVSEYTEFLLDQEKLVESLNSATSEEQEKIYQQLLLGNEKISKIWEGNFNCFIKEN